MLDKNCKEKNTGQKWQREKDWTKMVKRKTLDKNGKEKNTGQNSKEKNTGQKW